MEFRVSSGMFLCSLLFVLIGVGATVFAFFPLLFLWIVLWGDGADGLGLLVLLAHEFPAPFVLFGLVFLGAGSAMLYFSTKPVVFDKRKGFFWKRKKAPYDPHSAR
ncbi:MAG: hypothetical protein WGN25_05230 [Candidatus Electrothrix sp. GW3-4]|uniref:hypothetical protein n=1 Tax=Candidatus Electrothrix sp. GW3-4 TaxID=3126740 RepID=UPI0030CB9CDB